MKEGLVRVSRKYILLLVHNHGTSIADKQHASKENVAMNTVHDDLGYGCSRTNQANSASLSLGLRGLKHLPSLSLYPGLTWRCLSVYSKFQIATDYRL